MKTITLVFLIIVVASVVCNSYATLGSPHIIQGMPWRYKTHPAVFDLNLYKDKILIRSCKGAELVTQSKFLWVTAAECLDKKQYDQIEVTFLLLGKVYKIKFNIGIASYRVHPQYNKLTGENNIGLMTPLVQYIHKDPTIRRIQLPSKGRVFDRREAHVFFYQNTTKKGDAKRSFQMQSLQAKIVNPVQCPNGRSPARKKYTICVDGLFGKDLNNRNDTGLPLITREFDDTFRLVGIAPEIRIWVFSLKQPFLAEFLSIDPYLDWIKDF